MGERRGGGEDQAKSRHTGRLEETELQLQYRKRRGEAKERYSSLAPMSRLRTIELGWIRTADACREAS